MEKNIFLTVHVLPSSCSSIWAVQFSVFLEKIYSHDVLRHAHFSLVKICRAYIFIVSIKELCFFC